MKYINIDFKNPTERVEEIDKVILSVPEKRFLFNTLKKEISIEYHSIYVDNIKVPDSISISNLGELIKLKSQESDTYETSFAKLKMDSKSSEIKIGVDTSQVLDYNADDTYREVITFDVVFVPEEGAAEMRKNFETELVFMRGDTELVVDFLLDPDASSGIEHRKETKILLGSFKLRSIANHSFSDIIDWCNIKVYTQTDDYDDDVFFGENLILNSRNIKVDSTAKYDIKLLNLMPNKSVSVDLFTDLSRNDSPLDATEEYVYFSIEYSIKGKIYHKKHQFFYNLLPDKRSTALMYLIKTGNEFERLSSNKILVSSFQWFGSTTKGKNNCYTIRVGNYAESGDGKVSVKDFKFKFNYANETTSIILDKDSDLSDDYSDITKYLENLVEIIMVNDKPATDLPDSIEFENKMNSYIDLEVSFRHDAIGFIPKDIASVVSEISFMHKTSDEKGWNEFSSKIYFKIERNLGDSWLALDLGTSASVAAFASGEMLERNHDRVENLLIDLQGSLKDYIKNYGSPETEVAEKNTQFLSTEMILRQPDNGNIPTMESDVFKEDVVYISPSRGVYEQFRWAMVPYLKSLIGMDTIPDFNGEISNRYQYRITRSPDSVTSFKLQPIKVDSILKNTYNLMIRDFIVSKIPETEELNKVILTVPNTFTPKHYEAIRAVIDERFPNIQKDYINFISESDAVAVYYISNWQDVNANRDNKSQFEYNDEYILVYDIGAGTTDLTYFKISRSEDDEKNIEIIGKFGKSTAGNYLDYTIAQILEMEKPPEANYTYLGEKGDKVVCEMLKYFIREKIKPNLNNSFAFYINPGDGSVSDIYESDYIEMNTDTIVQHPIMEQYLKSNSFELFEKFFSLFDRLNVHEKETLEKGEFPIDTVVFTGRTIQFSGLRLHVQDEILNWTNSLETYFIENIDPSRLKSVVALGALIYAMNYRNTATSLVKIKNRNIYARYGFLYKDVKSGLWRFKELLNPSTRPSDSKPNVVDGLTIYSYDTDVYNALPKGETPYLDLRATISGFFVQSFSQHTAQDINENNWQYVTVMFSFSKSQIGAGTDLSKVRTRIEVKHNNDMIVTVGNYVNDPQAPLKIDTTGSETFKKSMWPYYSEI